MIVLYYAVVEDQKVFWSISKPRVEPFYTVRFEAPYKNDMIQPNRFIKQEQRILAGL